MNHKKITDPTYECSVSALNSYYCELIDRCEYYNTRYNKGEISLDGLVVEFMVIVAEADAYHTAMVSHCPNFGAVVLARQKCDDIKAITRSYLNYAVQNH